MKIFICCARVCLGGCFCVSIDIIMWWRVCQAQFPVALSNKWNYNGPDFAIETRYFFPLLKIKLLAPVALFVIFNGMLMPVAVWINSMDIDIGQVFDWNQIALSVLISLFFFFKVVTIRNYNGTINCVINYLMLH